MGIRQEGRERVLSSTIDQLNAYLPRYILIFKLMLSKNYATLNNCYPLVISLRREMRFSNCARIIHQLRPSLFSYYILTKRW